MTEPNITSLMDELLADLTYSADDDAVNLQAAVDDDRPPAAATAAGPTDTDAPGSRGAPALRAAPLMTLLPAPTEIVDLASVRQQRRNARAELVVDALHGSRECVAVIRDAFAGKVADFDDAVKALPILHRMIEHVEKIEAARNVRPALPTLNVEFNGTSFIVHPMTAAQAAPRLLETDE